MRNVHLSNKTLLGGSEAGDTLVPKAEITAVDCHSGNKWKNLVKGNRAKGSKSSGDKLKIGGRHFSGD